MAIAGSRRSSHLLLATAGCYQLAPHVTVREATQNRVLDRLLHIFAGFDPPHVSMLSGMHCAVTVVAGIREHRPEALMLWVDFGGRAGSDT